MSLPAAGWPRRVAASCESANRASLAARKSLAYPAVMAEPEQPERVAELEREVADLRAQLAAQAPSGDGRGLRPRPVSLAKLVMVIAVVALLTLGLMYAIFQALSAGFDSLAGKAAHVLTPAEDPPTRPRKPPEKAPATPAEPVEKPAPQAPIHVPGL